MGEWKLSDWFDEHVGEPIWMVCRNGHLWQAKCPQWYDFDEQFVAQRLSEFSRARLQAVTRCSLCRVLKEAGNKKLRGITRCHPDFNGVITEARALENGTIEHHYPEQVGKAYTADRDKEWRAFIALSQLQASWARRAKRKAKP